MGRKTAGIYAGKGGLWEVDKWYLGDRFHKRGFNSFEEADGWLTRHMNERRQVKLLGERPDRSFDQAAANYVLLEAEKVSIDTEIYQLKSVMPYIGHLELKQVNDDSLKAYVAAQKKEDGIAYKTINLTLGVVRHILNLATTDWTHENGLYWLDKAPKISMLELSGHQRPPRPISWGEQRSLLPRLPQHLARMALFALNSGVRDNVVCNLQWAWEIKVPELGVSVFEVPKEFVKGRKFSRVLVCNSVSQSVVEMVRGQHPKYVFVYRRERIKNLDTPALMPYRAIQTMNNTAWQRAREEAGLGDLHVHDLRHTFGMRLREAGVEKSTMSDLLWHGPVDMTDLYTLALLTELHQAMEQICEDSGRWNRTLAMLKREQHEVASNGLSA